MTKLIGLLFSLLMLTQVTMAQSANGVEQAFNKLEYTLNVQWDQKDAAVKNEIFKSFQNSLKGFDKTEIISYLRSNVLVDSSTDDLNNLIDTLNNSSDLGQEEVDFLVNSFLNDTQAKGSAFVGSAVGRVLLITLLVVVLVLTAPTYANNTGNCYWDNFYYQTVCF